LPRAIAQAAIHRVLPWNPQLSRFDPPNHPPLRRGSERPGLCPGPRFCQANRQTACKPGSVPPGTAQGRAETVAAIPLGRRLPGASCDRPGRRREGSPRATAADRPPAMTPAAPTWSCSRWGLPCRRRCRPRGALLPHHFTLAARPGKPRGLAVCFLWHCPWGCPRRALPGTAPPWSPDFPPSAASGERPPGRLAQAMWAIASRLSKAARFRIVRGRSVGCRLRGGLGLGVGSRTDIAAEIEPEGGDDEGGVDKGRRAIDRAAL
jgi:hypothetical protein